MRPSRRLDDIPGFNIDRVAAPRATTRTCSGWRTSTRTSRRRARPSTRSALEAGDGDVARATAEWRRRRDETPRQLDGPPVFSNEPVERLRSLGARVRAALA